MKLVFNKNSMAAQIAPLMGSTVNKLDIPSIGGILFEAKDGECTMTTYDLQKGLKIKANAEVLEEGSCVINAQRFYSAVRAFSEDTVTLTVGDDKQATLKCGKSRLQMNSMPGSDFPEIPALTSKINFLIPQGVLKKLINKVSYAMAANDHRNVLNGCYVRINKDKLMLVACDGFKIAKCEADKSCKHMDEDELIHRLSFIIPNKTVFELVRLLEDGEEDISIFLTKRHIVFTNGEYSFFSRLVDGEYIDFDKLFSGSYKIFCKVDRKGFLDILERSLIVTEERIAGFNKTHITLDINRDNGGISVSALNAQSAIYDDIECDIEGGDLVINFNNKFLTETLRSVETDKVKISLNTYLSAALIEPVKDENVENAENEEAEENADGEEKVKREENDIFLLLPVRTR